MPLKPLIAITATIEELRNKQQITIPSAYSKAVEDAGGIPVILPILSGKENITSIAGSFDGFVFSGGDDIRPSYYGEELLPHLIDTELSPDERTDFEVALLKEVMLLKKPVFGICLGMQLINVALGGSLIQDIPTQVTNPLNHRQPHSIEIKEGSLLYRILGIIPPPQVGMKGEGQDNTKNSLPFKGRVRVGMGFFPTNPAKISIISHHHQSVKLLGKDILISAVSNDGVIEAIELPEYPFLLGVQWHPERELESYYTNRLFKSFVEAC
ncbi:MAG: gamma-glutamyl-gamma-aminobutyrate hydrolase family protein [Nitrospirae bacterium]|nr:gamma-glutamyl-gamma-aminobutyrate hydrolase family protein [Nitrospirota bacterium]